MSSYYLVDANVLIALFRENDASHDRAVQLMKSIAKEDNHLVVLNLTLYECATVLSMKIGMERAKQFYLHYNTVIEKVIQFDEQLEDKAWRIFLKQKKKGTSFVDCALVATAKKLGMKDILTYDKWFKSCGFPLQYTQS
ncbi:MAG: PIN domain-containing protein [Patescibacteria group bacterium]